MCTCQNCENWMHDKVPVDIFDTVECAGTMISGPHQTVNIYFVTYRVIAALYITFVNVWAFYRYLSAGYIRYYFIYLTYWSLCLNLIYIWSSTILTFMVYQAISHQYEVNLAKVVGNASVEKTNDYHTIDLLNLRSLWRFVLFSLNATLSSSIFVIPLYWGLEYDPEKEVTALSWNTHGVAGGLVVIDFFCSTWQLTYRGALVTFALCLIYSIFTIIYYLAGGENKSGERYIYSIADWSYPGTTLGYAVVVASAMTIAHVGIVGIKNKLIIWWLDSRSEDEKAVLIQINDGNHTGHPDSDPNERIDVISTQTVGKHKNTNDLESGTARGIKLAETKYFESPRSVRL